MILPEVQLLHYDTYGNMEQTNMKYESIFSYLFPEVKLHVQGLRKCFRKYSTDYVRRANRYV